MSNSINDGNWYIDLKNHWDGKIFLKTNIRDWSETVTQFELSKWITEINLW